MDLPRPPPVLPKLCPEYSTIKTSYADTCADLSKTLTGYWVGLMPLGKMFEQFFPGIRLPPRISCPDYTEVGVGSEADMRKPWAIATLSGILPDHTTLFTSSEPHPSKSSPDVSFEFYGAEQAPSAATKPPRFSTLDIACAIECTNLPFLFQHQTGLLEYTEAGQGGGMRGRLAQLAEQHFREQHRLFLWQIALSHRRAHLIRWDRAGAIVSEGFDPVEDPWIFRLAWAYSRASRQQQGFDGTAFLLSHHRLMFNDCITQYMSQRLSNGRKVFSAVRQTQKSSSPVYRLDVPDERAADGVRPCLVAEPFYSSHTPLGRGTRVFIAYDLVDRELRIVKDSWRPEYWNALPEYVVLGRLADAGVEHIPGFICGGDVAEAPGDPPQATVTQDLATGAATAAWRLPCAPRLKFRKFVHTRILEDITLPLEDLQDSRELLIVIRDIAKAIKQARRRSRLMHCDITWFNIRWEYDANGNVRGVLVDWDHAERAPFPFVTNPDAPSASATWHFLPIRLMNDRQTIHDTVDDLESLYWSLLFGAFRFVEHDNPFILFGNRDFFSSATGSIPVRQNGVSNFINAKRGFLSGERLANVRWQSPNFQRFMEELTDDWACYYRLLDAKTDCHEDQLVPSDQWKSVRQKLSSPQSLIDRIDEALALPADGWADGDIVSNQLKKIPEKDIPVIETAISAADLDRSHMSVDPLSGMAQMAARRLEDPHSQSLMNFVTSQLKRRRSITDIRSHMTPGARQGAGTAEHGHAGGSRPTKIPRTGPGPAGPSSAKLESTGSAATPYGV
ncbi:hypothetical protein PsYK624_081850 [Phanerochaete sordida]|uniref:Fungal-type protein kinase domain-containing protein n=1 Tax=Phanerochaete sordida TaxID=48140 RepID=A0A9P3GA50_9APHY|nr:hypothetical protein PsYK624_081850 [Phanerochaete sordida]